MLGRQLTKIGEEVMRGSPAATAQTRPTAPLDAETARAPSRDAETAEAPSRDAETARAPSRDAETAGAPSRDAETARAPSRDAETARAPSRDAETARAPSRDAETARGPFMPTGPSLVLRDVFANPGSSITDITARTGLPQSYVSESVARLRGQGIVQTSADPADGRRTLVRVSAQHPRAVAAKGSVPVDAALAAALGEPTGGAAVTQIIATLSTLAARLAPETPGPIKRQLDQARRELLKQGHRELFDQSCGELTDQSRREL